MKDKANEAGGHVANSWVLSFVVLVAFRIVVPFDPEGLSQLQDLCLSRALGLS